MSSDARSKRKNTGGRQLSECWDCFRCLQVVVVAAPPTATPATTATRSSSEEGSSSSSITTNATQPMILPRQQEMMRSKLANDSEIVRCKFCGKDVSTQKKSERAIKHLLQCNNFITSQNKLPESERFKFFRNRSIGESIIIDHLTGRNSSSAAAAVAAPTPPLRNNSTMQEFMIRKPNRYEQHRFEELMAMHIYSTGSPFRSIESLYFRSAMNMLRPGIKVPGRSKISESLLDECYDGVRTNGT